MALLPLIDDLLCISRKLALYKAALVYRESPEWCLAADLQCEQGRLACYVDVLEAIVLSDLLVEFLVMILFAW